MDISGLNQIYEKIIQFNNDRGWVQHPSDLSKSIVIEASELLEHFQWTESSESLGTGEEKTNWNKVELEVADVLWYLLMFCHRTQINPVNALEKKIEYNEKKYPKSAFLGKHNKDFYKLQKERYRHRSSDEDDNS